MASIQKSGNVWRAQIYVCGVRESACFREKCEAESWALRREEKLRVMKRAITDMRRINKERTKYLESSKIYTHEEILENSIDVPVISGVYFLIAQDTVIYVGQSKNVHYRIAQHKVNKKFDRICIIECPEQGLIQLEALYIKKFKPIFNVTGINTQTEFDMLHTLIEIESNTASGLNN